MESGGGGGGGGGDEPIVSMEFFAENVQQLEPYDFVNKLEKREWNFIKLCLAVFCKFFGDFGGCLGRDTFSQRISKI